MVCARIRVPSLRQVCVVWLRRPRRQIALDGTRLQPIRECARAVRYAARYLLQLVHPEFTAGLETLARVLLRSGLRMTSSHVGTYIRARHHLSLVAAHLPRNPAGVATRMCRGQGKSASVGRTSWAPGATVCFEHFLRRTRVVFPGASASALGATADFNLSCAGVLFGSRCMGIPRTPPECWCMHARSTCQHCHVYMYM